MDDSKVTFPPPFKLGGTMYDQSTFKGRLFHFCGLVDPRSLFVSDTRLKAATDLLDSYQKGTISPAVTDKELWEAQRIKQSIIHPDTGQKVFMPVRMSGFIPFNTPVVVGLLLPNQSIGATILWQWLNQSHNAWYNYANRNATKPTPTSSLLMGYFGAVGSAVSIAVGLNVGLSKLKGFTPEVKALLGRFVPYPAVASANVCNVLLMRYSSLSSGIDVYDKTGTVIGSSQVAAKQAVTFTALTRVILSAPILLIPPSIMAYLEKTKFLRKNPRLRLPIHTLVIIAAFGTALPVATAAFPQESQIATTSLESSIQEKTSDEFLYYNKGL